MRGKLYFMKGIQEYSRVFIDDIESVGIPASFSWCEGHQYH